MKVVRAVNTFFNFFFKKNINLVVYIRMTQYSHMLSSSCLNKAEVVDPAASRVHPGPAEGPGHPQQTQSAVSPRDWTGSGTLQPSAQTAQHLTPWCGEDTVQLCSEYFVRCEAEVCGVKISFFFFFSQLEMRARRGWWSLLGRNQVTAGIWSVDE